MAKIQIYARIRPTGKRYDGIKSSEDSSGINVTIGEVEDHAFQPKYTKTPGSRHDFRFNHVFEAAATQEEVFETVAKDITDSFMEGFNATIFAYGQTSSGKTHTIEGGSRRFSDRGLIPRVLSYVYRSLEERSAREEVAVHTSYMEIYQDVGFDLLNPGMRPGALMVTLPKVHICEGPTGEVVVRNLSSHLAASEEVAHSLLFQGSTCRRVAETSMNQSSSRSHTIFSITLTSKPQGSEVITRSKLNLVDLAGSERVAKTGADNQILQEAKHINLSLHHLEHVIVSLQQQARRKETADSQSGITPASRQSSKLSSHTPGSRQSGRLTGHTPGSRHSFSHRNTPGGSSSSSMVGRQTSTRSVGGLNSSRQSPVRSRGRRSNEMMVSPSRDRLFYTTPTRSRSGTRPATRSGHIPYRNCMLTMVLRDSLGGNCLTAMIATISAEEQNIFETVSTCRFSQRVACIANKARRNEELDDKAVIKKLKLRVAELEREMATSKEQRPTTQQVSLEEPRALSEADRLQCHRILHDFFHGKTDNPVAAGIDTVAKFQECLKVLKDIVLHALGINRDASKPPYSLLHPSPPTTTPAVAAINSHSSSTDHKAETRSRKKSKRTKHHPRNENSSSHTNTAADSSVFIPIEATPKELQVDSSNGPIASASPHSCSRLSSGFGSLNEEGDPIVIEAGYNRLSLRGQQTTEKPGYVLPSGDPPSQTLPTSSPNTFKNPSSKNSVPTHSSPGQAHTQPKLHKSLSPRIVENLHQLKSRQMELNAYRQEEKLLADNVQLLDLRVQEEKLKSELSLTEEQLAAQHANLTRMLQQQQPNSELAYAEKIAEQQLRIKQTKLHQRLSDIQQQLHVLQHQQAQYSTRREEDSSITHYQQAWLSSSQVESELAKHELRQSKVQAQIESLRVSHMEKQLALKEASTRSKIQSLKQKLLQGSLPHSSSGREETSRSAPATSLGQPTPFVSIAGSSTASKGQSNYSHSSGTQDSTALRRQAFSPSVVTSASPLTAQKGQAVFSHSAKEADSIPSSKGHLVSPPSAFTRVSAPTSNVLHAFTSVASPPRPARDKDHLPTSQLKSPPTRPTNPLISKPQTTPAPHNLPITMQAWTKPDSPLACSRQLAKPSTSDSRNSTTPAATADTLNSTTKPQPSVSKETAASRESKSDQTEAAKPMKAKLTLPEEVKETEYMTALQRQKARVSRIRRCIVAATVIQRAWREHKHIS